MITSIKIGQPIDADTYKINICIHSSYPFVNLTLEDTFTFYNYSEEPCYQKKDLIELVNYLDNLNDILRKSPKSFEELKDLKNYNMFLGHYSMGKHTYLDNGLSYDKNMNCTEVEFNKAIKNGKYSWIDYSITYTDETGITYECSVS